MALAQEASSTRSAYEQGQFADLQDQTNTAWGTKG
jgi:hypothetical protein